MPFRHLLGQSRARVAEGSERRQHMSSAALLESVHKLRMRLWEGGLDEQREHMHRGRGGVFRLGASPGCDSCKSSMQTRPIYHRYHETNRGQE